MPKEHERKFLIWENGIDYTTPSFKTLYSSVDELVSAINKDHILIKQGYLPKHIGEYLLSYLSWDIDKFTPAGVRLRKEGDDVYYLTVKGKGTITRDEDNLDLPKTLFAGFWPETKNKRLNKKRLVYPYEDYKIEFDMYTKRDLIIAEIELPSIERLENVIVLGKEVTYDENYDNFNLAGYEPEFSEPEERQYGTGSCVIKDNHDKETLDWLKEGTLENSAQSSRDDYDKPVIDIGRNFKDDNDDYDTPVIKHFKD